MPIPPKPTFTNFTVSEIAQGMQRKANLGEEAELAQMPMSIPSQDLTLPKLIAKLAVEHFNDPVILMRLIPISPHPQAHFQRHF